MGMRRQEVGELGLTNFERFVAIVCWWQPFIALISLLFGSAPRGIRRHAKWSVLTVIAVFVVALILGLLFAGVGFLVAGDRGASVGASVGGFFGFFQFLAALLNTLAILTNRGPYFSPAGGGRFD